ncbi:MAG: hypothetical protein IKO41_00875 [Lachnospiraceae bacterium]|nr:hypothetical protein [Lachnospiraceae bacterium]
MEAEAKKVAELAKASLQGQIDANAKLERANGQVTTLEQQLISVQQNSKAELARLQDKLSEAHTKTEMLSAEAAAAKAKTEELQGQLGELRAARRLWKAGLRRSERSTERSWRRRKPRPKSSKRGLQS